MNTREPRIIAQGCRRWTCPVCGPRRKWQFVLRIVAAKPNRFITLTCTRDEPPSEKLATMVKQLPRLITYLRKTHGTIDYLRMLETCKDGYPHFHLLARSNFIPHADLKSAWLRLTRASVVDIRKAHGRSVGYVAKYIAKARNAEGSWSRQRVSVSRDFWRDVAGESDLLIVGHERTHPQERAEATPSLVYTRQRVGLYGVEKREPGEDNPIELVPTRISKW